MPEPTSAQYSLTVRVRLAHEPGHLGRVSTASGVAGGMRVDTSGSAPAGSWTAPPAHPPRLMHPLDA